MIDLIKNEGEKMASTSEVFGCNTCLPPHADNAWHAFLLLKIESELVCQSHFSINLRVCPNCQQHFIYVFTETIDWVDGEDPQFTNVLPVTKEESKQLRGAGSELVSKLTAMGTTRQSLCRDFPKGESPKNFWSTGITIGIHD